jgi:hypothetical protein
MAKTNQTKTFGSGPAGAANLNLSQSTALAAENSKLHHALVDAGLVSSRPTVAGNAGTAVDPKLLKAFAAAGIAEAEWLRLPSPRARCRLTGLSRTGVNELRAANLIRSIQVRKPGAQRGVVLINRASLLEYLAKLDAEQNGGVS